MENFDVIKIKNSYVVEKNDFITQMFENTATKAQMDLIWAVISMVKPEDTKFTTYKITYSDYAKILNPKSPDSSRTKKDIEFALKNIMQSYFRICTDKINFYYHWVDTAEDHKDEKFFLFRINDEVRDFYLQIKDNKTYLLTRELNAMSTIFQANVYRWCKLKQGFENKVHIDLDEAIRIFYNGKYIEPRELTRRIKLALEKINSKTTLQVSFEIKKKNCKTVGYDFMIKNTYKK